MADPDIREIQIDGRFAIPDGLEIDEVGRIEAFLRADQMLERFYREYPETVRPPDEDLRAAAMTAMAVYDERTPALPVGWQKFAVLQAGIAGSPDNLDSAEIQEWAYAKVKDENPHWLGDFDEEIDRGMPMRWLTQTIGFGVVRRRELAKEPPPKPKGGFFARFRG